MTPQDKAAFNAAWAIYCQQAGRNEEWEFKAGFEAALVHRDDKDRANARLIAAAPQLLELLREVVAYCYEHGHDWMCLAEATAIIRKATGGSDE